MSQISIIMHSWVCLLTYYFHWRSNEVFILLTQNLYLMLTKFQHNPTFEGETETCEYIFNWQTPAACPVQVCIVRFYQSPSNVFCSFGLFHITFTNSNTLKSVSNFQDQFLFQLLAIDLKFFFPSLKFQEDFTVKSVIKASRCLPYSEMWYCQKYIVKLIH